MADYNGNGNKQQSKDSMWDYANSVFMSFGKFHERIQSTYVSTRLRYKPPSNVPGAETQPAPTARALATVVQFVSLADSIPHATVLPKDNTEGEDKKTDKIERFLQGVPRSIAHVGMHPYDQFLHNFAEAGIGYVMLDLDEACALDGKFPFVITAPPPESVAFAFNKKELLCCVVKEMQEAAGLYEDLKGRWNEAQAGEDGKKKWDIPAGLAEQARDNPMALIDTLYLYTKEYQYFWVKGELVWQKPNWLKCVPLAYGLCVPLPSNKPEEYAMGMVYPELAMMVNEEKMLAKAYTGYEYFTMPLAVVLHNDGATEIVQVKPGAKYVDVQSITPLQSQPNYQSLQMLSEKADTAIGRIGIPDNVNLGEAQGNSGYQENILASGVNRRIEKQLDYAGIAIAKHFTMLLKGVETLATKEAAALLGVKGEEKVKTYLRSFSTVHHPPENPDLKAKARVFLTREDVTDYTEVEVSLKPELPQDENAKYNRAELAQNVHMSEEGIIRNVLKLQQPDQELAWRREDMLKNDPMWQEFLLRKAQKEALAKDPKLAAEFEEFVKAKEEAMATTPASAPPPVDPMQDPNAQMPTDMGQMNPAGGLTPDMTGLPPEMMPPAMAGQVPTSPIDQMLQAQMGGGY